MTRHFQHALRLFARQPLFTLTAVASLAIGIGANATIFSAANALLLAPTSGIRDQQQLVDVGLTRPNSNFDTMSYPNFADLRDRNRTLTAMYAYEIEPKPLSLGNTDGAQRIYGMLVSAGYFDVLGVTPAAGAFFHANQEVIGTPLRQVVLSDKFWRRQFAADPAIVGRDLLINGDPFTVAAVTPPGFQGTTILAPDVWVPLTTYARTLPGENMFRSRENTWLIAGGRLKPGITLAEAREDLGAIMTDLNTQYPDVVRGMQAAVTPSSRVPGEAGDVITPIVGVLSVIVGLVLLLACTNLAGLLLARAAARSREMSVRVALGASRWNLMQQLLAESLILFVAGGAAATLLAIWLTGVLSAMLPTLPFPVSIALAVDWRVLTFTFVLAVVAGLVTGLVPAWQSSRPDLTTTMKADASAPARQRLRNGLVAAQMGLCLLLLVVAGLLLRSLTAAATVDPGFRVEGVGVANIDLGLGNYTEAGAPLVTEQIRTRLQALPGVARVGVAAMVPLDGGGLGLGPLRRKGDTGEDRTFADWNVISPDFLPAIELPIVRGRNFGAEDSPQHPRVAIINERFAEQLWPGQDPIGKQLENGDFRPGKSDTIRTLTVVGVAKNAKYRWIGESPRNFIYVPMSQEPWRRAKFFVAMDHRADAGTDLTPTVRQLLRSIDPDLPLIDFTPISQFAALGMLPQRIAASVAGSLGSLALLLATVGLYGVMAYAVTRRTREIGVRIALGADHRDVLRMVLRQGLRLTAIGSIGGLALAGAAAFGLSSAGLLFNVSMFDPIAFGGTVLLMVAVALLATYIPARRAARTDPLTALRAE
jgi:predicted permease